MSNHEIAAFAVAGLPLVLHLLAVLTPEARRTGSQCTCLSRSGSRITTWSFDRRTLHGRDADKRRLDGEHRLSRSGEYAAKTINWLWLVFCAGIFRVLRNYLSIERAWLSALFASTPRLLVPARCSSRICGVAAVRRSSPSGRPPDHEPILRRGDGNQVGSSRYSLLIPSYLATADRGAIVSRAFLKRRRNGSRCSQYSMHSYVTAYVITGNPCFRSSTAYSTTVNRRPTLVDVRFRAVSTGAPFTTPPSTVALSRKSNAVSDSSGCCFCPGVPRVAPPAVFAASSSARSRLRDSRFQAYTYCATRFSDGMLAIPVALTAQEDRIFAYRRARFLLQHLLLGASQFQHRDVF